MKIHGMELWQVTVTHSVVELINLSISFDEPFIVFGWANISCENDKYRNIISIYNQIFRTNIEPFKHANLLKSKSLTYVRVGVAKLHESSEQLMLPSNKQTNKHETNAFFTAKFQNHVENLVWYTFDVSAVGAVTIMHINYTMRKHFCCSTFFESAASWLH